MEAEHRRTAEEARRSLEQGLHDRSLFRATLLRVPPHHRDDWFDLVLGLDGIPDDGPALPQGGVPYLPSSVDVLLRTIDEARVDASDVFVDVGSGAGRAGAFVHLLTGAGVIGLEIQPALVVAARELASSLRLSRVSCVEGDAAALAGFMMTGSLFFFYCPFAGARLEKVLDGLEPLARTRALRLCCVNLPLPSRPWLTAEPTSSPDLVIYRSHRC